jgi:V/A-type H+-transporting ATPase subunit I
MFVPAEMSEVELFVLEGDVEPVAQTIAEMGVMHLLDVNTLGEWAEDVSTEWTGRISAYATQARRIRDLLQMLNIPEDLQPCTEPLDPVGDLTRVEEALQAIETQARALRDEENRLRRDLERWELTDKSMELLAPLSVSISDLRQLRHLHMVAGTMPVENLARVETSLFRIPYTIMPVHRYGERVLIFAFCAQDQAAILDRALESAFLDRLEIPEEFSGTAQEVLEQVRRRIEEMRQRLEEVAQRRKELVSRVAPQLQALQTRVLGDQAIAEALSHFGHRGRVYLIAGWVPKDEVPRLRAEVEAVSDGRVTFEENSPYTPGANHQVPTLLRNAPILQPLESLVTTYGIPGYQELDPTPLLALTFVIMFGVMFGDLGHGLVLAAIGALAALRLVPALARFSSTGSILVACGLSSAVFGLLFGSVFGLEDVIPSLWLRPLDDIFVLLGASVAFGVVLLNVGFAFHLITAIRTGRFMSAIVDRYGIVGILLYWSLLGSILLVATGRGLPGWLMLVAVAMAALLFFADPLTNLLAGRRPLFHGNLAEGVVQSFFELFEAIISYVSNTLSYVRLGAFAVAHVGLTTVVLHHADMAGGPARIAVLILGNLFIIGFEGLIVGIQTLRLEYYELFGKFFGGEGIPFRPLTLPGVECELPWARAR